MHAYYTLPRDRSRVTRSRLLAMQLDLLNQISSAIHEPLDGSEGGNPSYLAPRKYDEYLPLN